MTKYLYENDEFALVRTSLDSSAKRPDKDRDECVHLHVEPQIPQVAEAGRVLLPVAKERELSNKALPTARGDHRLPEPKDDS